MATRLETLSAPKDYQWAVRQSKTRRALLTRMRSDEIAFGPVQCATRLEGMHRNHLKGRENGLAAPATARQRQRA